MKELEKIINEAWENKENIDQNSDPSVLNAVNHIIEDLDKGKIRVAEKVNSEFSSINANFSGLDLLELVRN